MPGAKVSRVEVDSRVQLKQIQGKQAVELSPPENRGILSLERLEDST
jgi:hypothetical protein